MHEGEKHGDFFKLHTNHGVCAPHFHLVPGENVYKVRSAKIGLMLLNVLENITAPKRPGLTLLSPLLIKWHTIAR